ncbi:alpha-amylase family glycosyl hydrolase [Anaerocolumna sp.]|uniref:alpha-amylase family glycosyl hydrolase n=1 Tax=Anaerocolumna sp. TaxID=2041569 RepID=UPI0028AC672C|nr:alpha-amylase family glycosyl hydrolase [Anaerocolumna sp.]
MNLRKRISAALMVVVLSLSSLLINPLPINTAAEGAVVSAQALGVTNKSALNETDIVYMVLTDRFYDGNPANNGTLNAEYRPGELKYTQGGDWVGLKSKLNYIKNLGVTAIWISPPSENELFSRDGSESGYHGYFTKDYYNPDPHYGTKQDLIDLVDEAHNLGLKVILDVVPNHMADYLEPYASSYSSPSYQPAAPFNNPSWFHQNGDILDWNNEWQVQNCDLGGLDDIDHSNPDARAAIKDVYKMWVDDTGVDGVRVDAARSVDKNFLREFEEYLGVPSFGEIFVGDVDYVSDYQNYEWGVLDFPLFFQAREVFANDASFYNVKAILDQDYKYNNVNRLVTFIDNHDRDRFLCLANDNYQKLRLALTFLFTTRGIPDVYYGTEQECYGGGKPTEWAGIANKENREVMPGFSEDGEIFKYIQKLTSIRKDYACLSNGTQREMWVEDNIYAYSRRDDSTGQEIITVINNGTSNETRNIPIRAESSISIGTKLTNLLDTAVTTNVISGSVTGKQISLTIPAKTAYVFTTDNVSPYTPPAKTITTIRVHYDVGLGNTMYLRGGIYPLWWDKGRSMLNISSDVWVYEIERYAAGEVFEFKPLINDTTWSIGNNFIGVGGQTIDIYPNF